MHLLSPEGKSVSADPEEANITTLLIRLHGLIPCIMHSECLSSTNTTAKLPPVSIDQK